jgi:hypothetical protein
MTEKVNRHQGEYNQQMIDLMAKIRNNEPIENHPFLTKMSPINTEKLVKPEGSMETDDDNLPPLDEAPKPGFLKKGVEMAKANVALSFRDDETSSPNHKSFALETEISTLTRMRETNPTKIICIGP